MKPTGFRPIFIIIAGALMALCAALSPPPLVAFAIGAVIFPMIFLWLDPRPANPVSAAIIEEPRPPMRPDTAEEAMPSAFARALVEKLPTPLLIISRTGRVSFANSAARTALPRLRLGSHFASLIRAPAFVEAVGAALGEGGEQTVQFTTHHDRERYFEARVAPLPANGSFGPEAQAIVQLEDRTQWQRAEQLRSDFIANASHELRTPLAAVIGYIETLQHHARDDPKAREKFLGIMSREAGRMQRLVDDLMSLSRIELSEHLRPVEAWSLNQIAADSAAALLPVAAQQKVTLRIEIEPVGAMVLGDRDQLAQVFTNLIDNAIKYAGPGTQVRVFATPPSKSHPNRHGVSVSDTGPGIAREHIHRLTERFYRVNVSSSRNKGGTGLGLAIVKHILNRHDGRLEITSALGEGSVFTVWLTPHVAEAGTGAPEETQRERNLRSA